MALSRNTRLQYLDPSLPLLQLPFEELNTALAGVQNTKNITDGFISKAPNYIRESATDRALAEDINNYQNSIQDQLTEIAATGDTRNYMSALQRAQRNIIDMYKPGGAADILSQRVAQKQERDKKLDEMFKNRPDIANYYKQATPLPELNYDPQTGMFNQIGVPNAVEHIDATERNDWFNKNLDNIKDSILQEFDLSKAGRKQLDAITSLHQLTEVKGVTEDKLRSILYNIYPDEFKQSLYQSERAKRFFNPDLGELDDRFFIEDKDGNLKPNLNNPIVKEIEGYVQEGTRISADTRFIKDQNELALEQFKSNLRKQEAEEVEKRLIIRTLPSGKAVPQDVEYYVRGDKLKKNTNASADKTREKAQILENIDIPSISTGNTFIAKGMKAFAFLDELFTSNDEVEIDSDPVLKNIKDHLSTKMEGFLSLSPEEQMKMVVDQINVEKGNSLQSTYNAGSSKFKNEFDKTFFDVKYNKEKDTYNMGNASNFKFTTRMGEVVTGQNLSKMIKDGEFGKDARFSYKGSVDDYTSMLPYGSTVVGIGDDEVYMEPDVMTTYQNETLLNAAWRAANNAEIGNTVNFKYKGEDQRIMNKPDGTFELYNKNTNTTTKYQAAQGPNGEFGLIPLETEIN